MSEIDNLRELKSAARNVAHAKRIKHVGALELVAQALGFPHWASLAKAEKGGWRPSSSDTATADELVAAANPFISIEHDPWNAVGADKFQGELQGHNYRVSTDLDDVRIWGRGWEVVLPEAPLAPARFRVTDRRLKANPLNDATFQSTITEVAMHWRSLIHARIASDWPRRATVPDGAGRAEHPLGHGVGKTWHCLHCDGVATATEITANLFHCPHCLASPMNIHTSPWWLGENQPSQP